jgi:hypothetical protein
MRSRLQVGEFSTRYARLAAPAGHELISSVGATDIFAKFRGLNLGVSAAVMANQDEARGNPATLAAFDERNAEPVAVGRRLFVGEPQRGQSAWSGR